MKRIALRIGKIILYIHVVLLISLVLTHCSFSHFARTSYVKASKKKPYDAIIVPGVPYTDGQVNNVMKMRVLWAKLLYDSGFTRNIIFSGSSVYSPYVEGKIMKMMADSLGIPTFNSFAETKAEHSTENVYYSWKMGRELGFHTIALATDPYQAGLLRGFVKEYCPGVDQIPIIFGVMDINNKTLPTVDAKAAFVPNFVSIVERQGFWERLRGTRGKRVRDEVRAEARKQRSTRN